MPYLWVDNEVSQLIAHQIDDIERSESVLFSDHARTLIMTTLNALRNDPAPVWGPQESRLYQEYVAFRDGLPHRLRKLAHRNKTHGRLTYFDILHELPDYLANECPFRQIA